MTGITNVEVENMTRIFQMDEQFPPIFSPKRYFLDAPKEQPGTCFVLNDDFEMMRRMYEVRKEEAEAFIADCHIMCNALQRIEAGEPEPRMIARRALESGSSAQREAK